MKSTRRLSINSILKKNIHLLEVKIADLEDQSMLSRIRILWF